MSDPFINHDPSQQAAQLPSGVSFADDEEQSPFFKFKTAFQNQFGRPLEVTGDMVNNPMHRTAAKQDAFDVRVKDLKPEHLSWMDNNLNTYGLKATKSNGTESWSSGPHWHLQPIGQQEAVGQQAQTGVLPEGVTFADEETGTPEATRVGGLLQDLGGQRLSQQPTAEDQPVTMKSLPGESQRWAPTEITDGWGNVIKTIPAGPIEEYQQPVDFTVGPQPPAKPMPIGRPLTEQEGAGPDAFKSQLYQADLGDLVDIGPDGKAKLKAGVTEQQFLQGLYGSATSAAGFTPEAAQRFMREQGQSPVGRFFQGVDPRNTSLGIQKILEGIKAGPTSRPSFGFVIPPAIKAQYSQYTSPAEEEQKANLERDIAAARATWADKAARAAIPMMPGLSSTLPLLPEELARNLSQGQESFLKGVSLGYVDPTLAGQGQGEKYTTRGAKYGGMAGGVAPVLAAGLIGGPMATALTAAGMPLLERQPNETSYDFEGRLKGSLENEIKFALMEAGGLLTGAAGGLASRAILGPMIKAASSGIGFAGAEPLLHGRMPEAKDLEEFATGAVMSLAHSIAEARGERLEQRHVEEAKQQLLQFPPAPPEVVAEFMRGKAPTQQQVGPFAAGSEGAAVQQPGQPYVRPNLDAVGNVSETHIPEALKVQPGAQPEAATPKPIEAARIIRHRDTGLPLLVVGEEGNGWVVKNPRTGNTYPMAKALAEEPAGRVYLKGSGEPLDVRGQTPEGKLQVWRENGKLEDIDPAWAVREKPEWRRDIPTPYSTQEKAEAAAKRFTDSHPDTTTDVQPAVSGKGYHWFWKERKAEVLPRETEADVGINPEIARKTLLKQYSPEMLHGARFTDEGIRKALELPQNFPIRLLVDGGIINRTPEGVFKLSDDVTGGLKILPEEIQPQEEIATEARLPEGVTFADEAPVGTLPPAGRPTSELDTEAQSEINRKREAYQPQEVTPELEASRRAVLPELLAKQENVNARQEATTGTKTSPEELPREMVRKPPSGAMENVIPQGATPQQAGEVLHRKYGQESTGIVYDRRTGKPLEVLADAPPRGLHVRNPETGRNYAIHRNAVDDISAERMPDIHREMEQSGLDARQRHEAFKSMGIEFKDPVQMTGTVRGVDAATGKQPSAVLKYRVGKFDENYTVVGRFPGGEKLMVLTPDAQTKIIQSPFGETGNSRVRGGADRLMLGEVPEIDWPDVGLLSDVHPTAADIRRVNPNAGTLSDLSDAELQKHFPQSWKNIQDTEGYIGEKTAREAVGQGGEEILPEEQTKEAEEPETVRKSRERLRQNLSGNTLSMNPVQSFYDTAVTVGWDVYKAATSGAANFEDWSKDMIKRLGDNVKPHLEAAWDALTKPAPIWFSPLERQIKLKMSNKMSALELRKMLDKAGLSRDELEWTNTNEFLKQKANAGEPITKKEMLEHLAKPENQIQIKDVWHGGESALNWEEIPSAREAAIQEDDIRKFWREIRDDKYGHAGINEADSGKSYDELDPELQRSLRRDFASALIDDEITEAEDNGHRQRLETERDSQRIRKATSPDGRTLYVVPNTVERNINTNTHAPEYLVMDQLPLTELPSRYEIRPNKIANDSRLPNDHNEYWLLVDAERKSLYTSPVEADMQSTGGKDGALQTALGMLNRRQVVDSARNIEQATGIVERRLGAQKEVRYAQYSTPGGKNQRELLLTLPEPASNFMTFEQFLGVDYPENPSMEELIEARKRYDTQMRTNVPFRTDSSIGNTYRSPHWDEPNVLAHIRMNDRDIPIESIKEQYPDLYKRLKSEGRDTARGLHIEEAQSDWQQSSRKMGVRFDPKTVELVANEKGGHYEVTTKDGEFITNVGIIDKGGREGNLVQTPGEAITEARRRLSGQQPELSLAAGIRNRVPAAPFQKNWQDMAFKRLLREASEKGYDLMTWSTGAEQFKRWGSPRVDWARDNLTLVSLAEYEKMRGIYIQPGDEGKWIAITSDGRQTGPMPFSSKEAAGKYVTENSRWKLVTKEQQGGNAGGIDIEGEALRRNILKANSETVETKTDLRQNLEEVMNREKDEYSPENWKKHIDAMTDKVWARMQKEDVGSHLPRLEGFRGFYDKMIPDFARSYGKRYGAKVETIPLWTLKSTPEEIGRLATSMGPEYRVRPEDSVNVHAIDVSSKIRDSVIKAGQSLFGSQEGEPSAVTDSLVRLQEQMAAKRRNPSKASIQQVNSKAETLTDLKPEELQTNFPEASEQIDRTKQALGDKAGTEAIRHASKGILPEESNQESERVRNSRQWLQDRANGGTLGAGQEIIPAMYHTAIVTGSDVMKAGKYAYGKAEDFAAWSKDMVGRLGDRVKPYLDEVWSRLNERAPQWFSPLENTIKLKMPNRASADQVKGILRGGGFILKGEGGLETPNDEAHWTGLYDFLQRKSSAKEQVAKQEVLDHLVNGIQLTERQFSEVGGKDSIAARNRLIAAGYDTRMSPDEPQRMVFHLIGKPDEYLTADEMPQSLQSDAIRLQERQYGHGTKFTQHVTPGGTNEREFTLSLPSRRTAVDRLFNESVEQEEPPPGPERDAWRQRIQDARSVLRSTRDYRVPSGHQYGIDEADINRIAIIRTNDRVGPNGEKILHVDEYQDDLQNQIQALKKKVTQVVPDSTNDWTAEFDDDNRKWVVRDADGEVQGETRNAPTPQDAIMAVAGTGNKAAVQKELQHLESLLPFRGKSHELAMKRVLDLAVKEGYDKVSWATGDQIKERYFGHESVDPTIVRWNEISKPQSVRKELLDYLGSELAFELPLKSMDTTVLPALKNDQVRRSVTQSIPVNVMNILASNGVSADELIRQPDMIGKTLPVDVRSTVARGIVSALQLVGARLRTALNRTLLSVNPTGRNEEVLPAVRASDIDPLVVWRGLTHPGSTDLGSDLGTSPVVASGAGNRTESTMSPNGADLTRKAPKLLPAQLAEALNRHADIVAQNKGLVNPEYVQPPPNEGKNKLYDELIPNFLSKYTKRWGGKVGETEINTGTIVGTHEAEGQATVHSLDITPEIKDTINRTGQPLFGSSEGEPPAIIDARARLAESMQGGGKWRGQGGFIGEERPYYRIRESRVQNRDGSYGKTVFLIEDRDGHNPHYTDTREAAENWIEQHRPYSEDISYRKRYEGGFIGEGSGIAPTHEMNPFSGARDVIDMALVEGYNVYRRLGAQKFAGWSNQMIKRLGDSVRPHLESTWVKVKAFYENEGGFIGEGDSSGRSKGTTNWDDVDEAIPSGSERRDAGARGQGWRANTGPQNYEEGSEGPEPVSPLPPRTIKQLWNGMTLMQRMAEGANVPRTLVATGNFHAVFKHGAILGYAHPIDGLAIPVREMLRAFWSSPDKFKELQQEMMAHPRFQQSRNAGVEYTGMSMGRPEEEYMSRMLTQKIPTIRRFEQSFSTFLNSQRLNVYSDYADALDGMGADFNKEPNPYYGAARFINAASGRGDLGQISDATKELMNGALFSPRYMKSRWDILGLPTLTDTGGSRAKSMYQKMDPMARKLALTDMFKYAGVVGTTMGLAALAGAKVTMNPEDPDFGKMVIGNTHYDVTGGSGQYLRLMARLARDFYKMDPKAAAAAIIGRPDKGVLSSGFIRNHLAPTPSALVSLYYGKDFKGDPVTAGNMLASLITPMFLHDAYEGWKDAGLIGAVKTTPAFFGASSSTYPAREQQAPKGQMEQSLLDRVRARHGEAILPDETKERLAAEKDVAATVKAGDWQGAQLKYEQYVKKDILPAGGKEDKDGQPQPDTATVNRIKDRAELTPLQYLVKHNRDVDLEAALDAFLDGKATDAERREIAPIVLQKEEAFEKAANEGKLTKAKISIVRAKAERANKMRIWDMAAKKAS